MKTCKKCGEKLSDKKLCGWHLKPICQQCNACEDCTSQELNRKIAKKEVFDDIAPEFHLKEFPEDGEITISHKYLKELMKKHLGGKKE